MKNYSIKLDRERNFKYGVKSISLIERNLNTPIAKFDISNLTIYDTAVFIWAGLIHEDPELTPDMVLDLIDDHSELLTVTEIATKAMLAAAERIGKTGK